MVGNWAQTTTFFNLTEPLYRLKKYNLCRTTALVKVQISGLAIRGLNK